MKLLDELRRRKAKICVYDPTANENESRVLGDSVTFAKSVRERRRLLHDSNGMGRVQATPTERLREHAKTPVD